MADISFGSSRTSDPAVVRYAFERGSTTSIRPRTTRPARRSARSARRLPACATRCSSRPRPRWASESRTDMMRASKAASAGWHRPRRRVLQPRGERRRAREEPRVAGVRRAGREAGQDPLERHVGSRRPLAECLDFVLANDLVDVILVAHNFAPRDRSTIPLTSRPGDELPRDPDCPDDGEPCQCAWYEWPRDQKPPDSDDTIQLRAPTSAGLATYDFATTEIELAGVRMEPLPGKPITKHQALIVASVDPKIISRSQRRLLGAVRRLPDPLHRLDRAEAETRPGSGRQATVFGSPPAEQKDR